MTKKDAARILYFEGTSQSQISKIIGTSQTTISTWKKNGDWDKKLEEQNNIQETNEDIIRQLINYQLGALKRLINHWKEQTLDVSKPNLIGKGEIDALSKLYSTIKKKDIVWTNYVQIIKEFMNWLQINNLDLAKSLVESSNQFLNEKRTEL